MAPMIVPPLELNQPVFAWYKRNSSRDPPHTAQEVEEKKKKIKAVQ